MSDKQKEQFDKDCEFLMNGMDIVMIRQIKTIAFIFIGFIFLTKFFL